MPCLLRSDLLEALALAPSSGRLISWLDCTCPSDESHSYDFGMRLTAAMDGSIEEQLISLIRRYLAQSNKQQALLMITASAL